MYTVENLKLTAPLAQVEGGFNQKTTFDIKKGEILIGTKEMDVLLTNATQVSGIQPYCFAQANMFVGAMMNE